MSKRRISTNFFVWAYALGVGLPMAGCLFFLFVFDLVAGAPAYVFAYGSTAFSIFGLVVFFVFIHKTWAAIQDGHARTSAGKAVGFLLIPFFNVYWLFQATWGFAKDYNRHLDRHNIKASRLSEGLYLAFSILFSTRMLYKTIATLKPITGVGTLLGPYSYFLMIPVLVLGIIVIHRSCEAINALPRLTSEGLDIQSSTTDLETEVTP